MADKLYTAHVSKLAPDLSLELNTNNAYYSKPQEVMCVTTAYQANTACRPAPKLLQSHQSNYRSDNQTLYRHSHFFCLTLKNIHTEYFQPKIAKNTNIQPGLVDGTNFNFRITWRTSEIKTKR